MTPPCLIYATSLGAVTFATGTTTLDTSLHPYGFNYTSLTIPAGAIVTGAAASHGPLNEVCGRLVIARSRGRV